MPCACKNTPVNVPDNLEWGPAFWSLLHGMAERCGSAPLVGLRADETRAWKILLTTLHKTLPCEHCRDHLNIFLQNNPVSIPDNYSEMPDYIRKWLYNLHENVNKRTGKASFPFTHVGKIHGRTNLRQKYDILNILLKRSILGSVLPLMSWNNWSNQAKTLLGIYG